MKHWEADNANSDEAGHDPGSQPATPNERSAANSVLTETQLAEARRYHRQQLVCELTSRLVDFAVLAVLAILLARPLDEWLAALPGLGNRWLRLAAMYLLLTGIHVTISFPFSIFSGHVLEHRFGLSRQSWAAWLWRYTKRQILSLVFGLLMVLGLYLIISVTGRYWWLAGAGAFFLVSIVLGQLVPVLILPLFYKITRLDDESLADRFRQLADGTGLSIEGVYRMQLSDETVKANAMLAGLGRTRRVILGDTLLDDFSGDEIAVVFAHEVGHHVRRHIMKLMALGVVFSIAGFSLCDRVLALWVGQVDGSVPYAQLPVHALPVMMLVIGVFSLVLEPLINSVQRHFEREADWYALRATQMVDAYRTAFARLARRNKADPEPHPLEVFLFHSHPPIAARLAMADKFTPVRSTDR
jgi:STE24 endopeptidase